MTKIIGLLVILSLDHYNGFQTKTIEIEFESYTECLAAQKEVHFRRVAAPIVALDIICDGA